MNDYSNKNLIDMMNKAPKDCCTMCGLEILSLFPEGVQTIKCPSCNDEQDRDCLISEWDDYAYCQ